jgi:hypothetical protein
MSHAPHARWPVAQDSEPRAPGGIVSKRSPRPAGPADAHSVSVLDSLLVSLTCTQPVVVLEVVVVVVVIVVIYFDLAMAPVRLAAPVDARPIAVQPPAGPGGPFKERKIVCIIKIYILRSGFPCDINVLSECDIFIIS